MPKSPKYNSFSLTGWPSPCHVWWGTSGGLMLGEGLDGTTGKPGAGKHIHVIGVSAQNSVNLRLDTSGGGILLSIPGDADGLRFPGAVDMGEDTALFADSGNDVTIFYYIHDSAIN